MIYRAYRIGPAGWIAAAFGLVLVAALLAMLFVRDNDGPTITIIGEGPLLLFQETTTSGSPILLLEGTGNPAGGTYRWSVISGADKIDLQGDVNANSISIKPAQQSDSQGDVILHLAYTTSNGTAIAQVELTVYTPSSAMQISSVMNPFNGPTEYGYDFTVRYMILDQFGERFPSGFLYLNEDLVVLLNPYNTHFEEREYISDENAEYDDHYTLIFNNQAVPSDYLARVQQIVKAQGVKILDHILIWKSSGVEFE